MAQNMGLETLTSPARGKPRIFTFVSEGGIGKTTLGSLFPNPVFIRTEDGTVSLEDRVDVALFPVAETTGAVLEAVYSLINTEHSFKTLVIDTVTQLNVMAETEIVKMDGKAKSVNTALGGYGAGHAAVAGIHRDLRDACGYLSEKKGMHIVFLAHADIDIISLPDQDQFMQYTLRLNKRSLSSYVDNVDCVGYIKLKIFTTGDGEKQKIKATTDQSRIITCYPTPSHVSKNRFGITQDIPFNGTVNPFAQYLGGN